MGCLEIRHLVVALGLSGVILAFHRDSFVQPICSAENLSKIAEIEPKKYSTCPSIGLKNCTLITFCSIAIFSGLFIPRLNRIAVRPLLSRGIRG